MDQNKSLQKIDPEKSLKILSEDSSLAKRGLRDIGIWPKIEELFEKLKSQYEAEKYQDCIITADEILKTDSNHFYTLCYYGRSLYHLERYEEALKIFNRCLEEEREYFYLWSFRGDTFYKIKNYEKAIPDYLKSLKLEPNNGAGYDNVAMCLFLNGDHEKAHEYINKAIAIETTEDMPMIRKAQFFEFQNLKREAAEQYKKTLNNFPNSEYAKKKIVEFLRILAEEQIGNNNQEALIDIDSALSYAPDNTNLISIKAILLDVLGDNKQAIELIDKAKKNDPDNSDLDFVYKKIHRLS
jgi:tetratricopeptide (TPR) repeat protein